MVAPEDVRASAITPVSAQISWYPANSNCEHQVLLNGVKVGTCPPGVHQIQMKGLIPSTMYRSAIRAKNPRAVLEEKPVEGFVDLKTLPKSTIFFLFFKISKISKINQWNCIIFIF